MSKYDGNPSLSVQSTSTKNPPSLISVDEARIKMIIGHIEATGGRPDEEFMLSITPEELRALYFHYTGQIKANIGHTENQQSMINYKAKQINQLQNLRRLLEDIRDRFKVGCAQYSFINLSTAFSVANRRQ